MDPLELYSHNAKAIESIYRSRLKIQILLGLSKENATLGTLRKITGSTSQALIPKIRGLESQYLIESKGYEYTLTPLGKIVSSRLIEFIRIIGTLNRYKEFWATHDVSGIPPPFLSSIDLLLDADVVYDTPEDIVHIYTLFMDIVRDASYIYGVSTVMSPGFADALAERIRSNIPVELVVNKDVLKKLGRDQYLNKFQAALSYPNFKVWIVGDPIRIGLTVTDKYLSLGLFKKGSAVYDSSSDVFSTNPTVVEWGVRLFEYFKQRSSLLTMGEWTG